MANSDPRILSPVGAAFGGEAPQPGAARTAATARGTAIGLLDNSKPNVSYFLEELKRELLRAGNSEIVCVTKPRSAGPSPDIPYLAERCRFVINAVGD